ncbi:CoA-disulfide reductase [Parabacteroides faecis]|uniref:NADPH-dependent 2,4-dienoyl-CoA reductase/sulfur reductase-like enzyme/peroxiredoxin family protein/rhodanese-related sulfurtransferase/TusA-related sulfurtransferase n=1 Tax=Parabacteroides faecis TaxID=1217282 RepID=A0ABR6KLI9_9BACT|nr:CoA-disulfide reductase [Parabacteroides faecis]MBB4622374.1 NADPH-dependent 2,4-dienoyl-CoA reductase/sulfur reductase-like enzyme/peroxiredoxin family protein/rhodanese-related sulfurtransferase/TusA-related sulfurtransferase [Parabacteroides faecis]GGK11000.1 pyridine nucleotide-disulfide oxidoreductase [Parabacteroides faecis]
MKYLIVGGVAGGATVAARLRRIDENAEIILFERGKYVSYANCGLPYYIGGTIAERDKLFVQTAQGFTARFNIDIRTEQEVTAIHPKEKTVEITDINTARTYSENYDKLILSPGAEPLRPGIEGINSDKIFTLRNVPDTDTIKKYVSRSNPRHAVVVGGGFIGLEMAENLHQLGIQVAVVEMANQVMAPLDYSMAAIVHQQLTDKQVDLRLEDGVSRFEETPEGIIVHLRSGKQITTDLVILSIGVRPETRLAKEAGLSLGTLGGIAINDYMQTSDPDIYALGDAVEVRHLVTGKPALIPLAGPANKQGRIVANNIVYGNRETYPGTMGTSIAKVFDLTVAAAGANAKLLKREGITYQSSYTHSASHAGYYPGAVPMSVKILFSPENGQLLGAQIVGFDGVDKRIEMFAQVIQRKGTVYDLATLEHAYAPPYSSAKDPVNMAGYVAENILTQKVEIVHWRDIAGLQKDTLLLDVRTADEYSLGTLPNAINIPVDELRTRLSELPKDKSIVVSCAVGLRGYLAYRILTQHGFKNVKNLSGGYKTWSVASAKPISVMENGTQKTIETPKVSRPTPSQVSEKQTVRIDACGLQCPGPVLQLKKHYAEINTGDRLLITATDQGFGKDVAAWCNMTGAQLVGVENKSGVIHATIEKGEPKSSCKVLGGADNKTLIVFSDDLDKALASFVIANGAASTGKKVTMFFTFWGLNVIKKRQKPSVSKDLFGKMFGWMLPSHSSKLKLSKMNMGGAGSWMMRLIMKKKHIDSLESLIAQAAENGIEMIACTMSMDVMGVKKEELMDNVTLGGVATYLERAEEANINLFI